MKIKVATTKERMNCYVTSVEHTAKDEANKISEHITLAVEAVNEEGENVWFSKLVLFPTGHTAPYFDKYLKGLVKATKKAREENPEAPAIHKIDDEEKLIEAFPKSVRTGSDPLMFKYASKLLVELDKPMHEVWRSNAKDVTVSYQDGDRSKPIRRNVKAGEFVIDPTTGQKKVRTHVEIVVVYVASEGEATADIANYADVWNNATRTLRPMPNEVAQMSVATEQQAEKSAEQQAINSAQDPFAK